MELFKPGYRKRKLYLGYSEIGKTLWHMYEADDKQAAQRKQSNPKQSITNEIALARQFNRLARARKPFPKVETLPDSARRLVLPVPQG